MKRIVFLLPILLVAGLFGELVYLEMHRSSAEPVTIRGPRLIGDSKEQPKTAAALLQVQADTNKAMTGLECPKQWLGNDLKHINAGFPEPNRPKLFCFYAGRTTEQACIAAGATILSDANDKLCRKSESNGIELDEFISTKSPIVE